MALLIPELSPADVAVFARLCISSGDFHKLPMDEQMQCSAVAEAAELYASGYTGLGCQRGSRESSEPNRDLQYACMVVAAEMIDNRQMVTQYTTCNPTVMHILNMHSVNLL